MLGYEQPIVPLDAGLVTRCVSQTHAEAEPGFVSYSVLLDNLSCDGNLQGMVDLYRHLMSPQHAAVRTKIIDLIEHHHTVSLDDRLALVHEIFKLHNVEDPERSRIRRLIVKWLKHCKTPELVEDITALLFQDPVEFYELKLSELDPSRSRADELPGILDQVIALHGEAVFELRADHILMSQKTTMETYFAGVTYILKRCKSGEGQIPRPNISGSMGLFFGGERDDEAYALSYQRAALVEIVLDDHFRTQLECLLQARTSSLAEAVPRKLLHWALNSNLRQVPPAVLQFIKAWRVPSAQPLVCSDGTINVWRKTLVEHDLYTMIAEA